MNGSEASAPIVCNPLALSDRPRYRMLSDQLRAAISERSDLPNGFTYTVDGQRMSIAEVGEWMTFERQCCPFLCFRLSISGFEDAWQLTLTGPDGAKNVLEREF